MPKVPDCRFCRISDGKQNFGVSDVPFLENDNFFAIPSIGALVEGWSLIVPKKHAISLRDVYGTSTFNEFSSEVIRRITSNYGKVVLFEHGPTHEGSLTSCGTDHAHLHVVPLPFSLHQELINSDLIWQPVQNTEIASIALGREYLFYSDSQTTSNASGLVHVLEKPISQFFRKLIATKLGKSEISDYRQFLHLDTAQNTRSRLASPQQL